MRKIIHLGVEVVDTLFHQHPLTHRHHLQVRGIYENLVIRVLRESDTALTTEEMYSILVQTRPDELLCLKAKDKKNCLHGAVSRLVKRGLVYRQEERELHMAAVILTGRFSPLCTGT